MAHIPRHARLPKGHRDMKNAREWLRLKLPVV